MKILQVEPEFFRADGRADVLTDIRKLTVAFCNSSNAPKNIASLSMPEYTESRPPSANCNTLCYQHSSTILVLLLPPF